MDKRKYRYDVFVGSIFWKSFSNKKLAIKEASRLRKDGAKRVKINRVLNE